MTPPNRRAPQGCKSSVRCRGCSIKNGFACILAVVVLSLSGWFAPAWAILPPLPRQYDDTAVQVQGTVLAITHTDKDRGLDPRSPTSTLTPGRQGLGLEPGVRRVERIFDLKVRIRKTVKARNPAMPPPPSGKVVILHGVELFGPWPQSGVDRIDRLTVGTKARFYIKKRNDGAWFILEPDGLELLDGS